MNCKGMIRSIVPPVNGEAVRVTTSVQTFAVEKRMTNCCSRSLNCSSFSVHEQSNRAINGSGVLEPVSSLLLRTGTYDFYALTPDLAVANVDHEGDGAKCAVAVEHGMDYATSLTAGQTVSEASPTVVLNDLGRHCTKLIFELMPKAGNIRSVDIASAGLTNMTRAPVSAILNTALPIMGVSKSEELTIEGSEFSVPDDDLNTSAFAVVLPREAGKFKFKMNVAFNERE